MLMVLGQQVAAEVLNNGVQKLLMVNVKSQDGLKGAKKTAEESRGEWWRGELHFAC